MQHTGPRRIGWVHVLLAGALLGGVLRLCMEHPDVGVHVLCVTGGCLIGCIGMQYDTNRALQEKLSRLEMLLDEPSHANPHGGQDVSV